MAEGRRWPSPEEVLDKARRGVLDDRMAAVPPYDLDPDEILSAEDVAELERRIAEEARQQRP
jgi:hypothetical protein